MNNLDFLQILARNPGEYFIVSIVTKAFGALRYDYYTTYLISPDLPDNIWNGNLEQLTYKQVIELFQSSIKTNIPLGTEVGPFQWGIRYSNIVSLQKCTCNALDLIIHCRNHKVSDFLEVLKVMKELTRNEDKNCNLSKES